VFDILYCICLKYSTFKEELCQMWWNMYIGSQCKIGFVPFRNTRNLNFMERFKKNSRKTNFTKILENKFHENTLKQISRKYSKNKFHENTLKQISRKSAQCEANCSMRTHRRTEMAKLTVAFRHFSKAPKDTTEDHFTESFDSDSNEV